MRRLAARTMRASCSSAGSSESDSPSKASVAIADATSPAFAPPIPSATTKNGGRATRSSSFTLRWRPTSVFQACSAICSATRLLLVAVFAIADPDHIRHLEPLGCAELAPVQVGPVRGAHVLDVHEVSAREDAGVSG